MSGKRQKNQQQLAFLFDEGSEAPGSAAEGAETLRVEREPENPAGNQQWMEEVCERGNLREALQRVRANKGSPGIDGMTVDQLPDYLKHQSQPSPAAGIVERLSRLTRSAFAR
jgi:RNA-directed DNA polymerase